MAYIINSQVTEAFWRFVGSIVIFILMLVFSKYKRLKYEKIFIIAALRGFVQLLILAGLFVYIFQLNGIIPLFAILFSMITFASYTASERLKRVPDVFRIEIISLGISVTSVMILMSILQVLPLDNPAFWIPIGGMITGNSMNTSYLIIDKITDEVQLRQNDIEAALSLGVHPAYILQNLEIIPNAIKTAVTPSTNNMKTLGLVFIPGLMTGLLIGGLDPVAAAFLQIMIFFLIIGSSMFAGIIAAHLLTDSLFDPIDQTLIPLAKTA